MLKALAQDDLSAAFIKGDSPLNNVGSLYCKQQVLISLLVMCYKSYYLLLLYSCFFLQKNQHKTGQIGHRKILHIYCVSRCVKCWNRHFLFPAGTTSLLANRVDWGAHPQHETSQHEHWDIPFFNVILLFDNFIPKNGMMGGHCYPLSNINKLQEYNWR